MHACINACNQTFAPGHSTPPPATPHPLPHLPGMLPRLHPLAGVCEAVLSDETHHPAPDSSAAVQQRRSSGTAGRKGDHQKHGAAHRGPDHGNIHTAAWKQTKAAGQGPLTPLHPPETLTPGGCTHGATWPSPGSASRAGRRAREARPGQAGEAREGRAGKGDRQQAEVNGLLQNTATTSAGHQPQKKQPQLQNKQPPRLPPQAGAAPPKLTWSCRRLFFSPRSSEGNLASKSMKRLMPRSAVFMPAPVKFSYCSTGRAHKGQQGKAGRWGRRMLNSSLQATPYSHAPGQGAARRGGDAGGSSTRSAPAQCAAAPAESFPPRRAAAARSGGSPPLQQARQGRRQSGTAAAVMMLAWMSGVGVCWLMVSLRLPAASSQPISQQGSQTTSWPPT